MHLFNCQVLLNFVRKLRCPIYSLTIVALSMGMTLTLKNGCPVSPNMATDRLDYWVLTKFNFISYQLVGLLAKLEHPISSLLLGIFILTLDK